MRHRILGMASIAVTAAVVWACSDGGPAPTEVDPNASASLYQANAPGGGGGKVKGGELPTGCVPGQVAIRKKSLDPNNEEWICANDRDRLGDLDGYACTDGQIPKWDASLRSGLGDWYCAADDVGGGSSGGPTLLWARQTCSKGICTQLASPGLTMTINQEKAILAYTTSLEACVVSGSVNETGTSFNPDMYITSGVEISSTGGTIYVRLLSVLNGPADLTADHSFGVMLVCP